MPSVFRFAPSPNGYLHLGHALSAVLNADMAKAKGGRLILRIEDIDQARCRSEFEAAIYEDLAWIGVEWEKPVRRQSEHLEHYRAALTRYGITQNQLQEHLLWQVAALQFTEARFGSESPRPPEEHTREAVKSDPAILAWPVPNGSAGEASSSVDREMEGWLKDARQRTKVEFYKEAFE